MPHDPNDLDCQMTASFGLATPEISSDRRVAGGQRLADAILVTTEPSLGRWDQFQIRKVWWAWSEIHHRQCGSARLGLTRR
jgi:hypothetical protein